MIATPAGFFAAGADRAGQKPAAVSSIDGVSWQSEAIGGTGRTPSVLAAWGERLLAAGAGETSCAHPFGLDTWVRSATGTWTEAPFTDLLCRGGDVRIDFVGDVAILAGSGPGDSPVVWSSTDGLHWADHGQAFAGLLPKAVISVDGRATLIAGGPTATWSSTSTDGSRWTAPSPIAGLTGGLQIEGAFMIGATPTIVASRGGLLGTIRPDGNGGWVKTPATGLTADDLGTITAFSGGLLATGGNGPGAHAWVSRDGASWRPLELPQALAVEGAGVGGVAVGGGRAILIGAVPGGFDNPTSAIWTGSVELLTP